MCGLELTPGMSAVQSARQVFGHYIAVVKQALNRTASFEAGKAADQLLAAVQSTEDTGQSGGERLPLAWHGHPDLISLHVLYRRHNMFDAGLSGPAACVLCIAALSVQRAAACSKQTAPADLQATSLECMLAALHLWMALFLCSRSPSQAVCPVAVLCRGLGRSSGRPGAVHHQQ